MTGRRDARAAHDAQSDDAVAAHHLATTGHELGTSSSEGNQIEREPAAEGNADTSAHVTVKDQDDQEADVVERHHENFLMVYLRRLKGAGHPGPSFFTFSWDAFPAFLFTAITLMILAVIEAFGLQPYNLGLSSYLPSFGASCCLVMSLLTSPGAQPRAVITTHVLGAFLGVSWGHITNDLERPLSQLIACAFAIAISTSLMMLTGTLQPSASATTCLAAFHVYGQMKDQGFMFMIAPALIGGTVVSFMGIVFNNLIPWRHCYPLWW